MKNKTTLEQTNELHNALQMRAVLGQRHGWAYAIKWFSEWQKIQAQKNKK